jgi:subtilase family serine protease
MKLEFIGANPRVTPRGRDATPAVVSYFTGPRSQWKTGVTTYGAVVYEDLWPGIDMVYDGAGGRLKYTFLVKPGADPSRIRLAYRGSTGVSVTDAGELTVATPVGALSEAAPYSYQEKDGRQDEVPTSYAVSQRRAGEAVVGFRLGRYDASRPLVVDPATFVYVGYIGGSAEDIAKAIAVDAAGNAYVTGYTSSIAPSFPAQVGPDLVQSGRKDAFVVKLKADGTGLEYAGFIGGSSDDVGWGIAVDAMGNAYVAGGTRSSTATFPVTVGPGLVHSGNYDAFVAKVSADGTSLVYCGYIGGDDWDVAGGIAVHADGHAYVTGVTYSGASFPVIGGPSLSFGGGDYDGFVAKVAPDGSGLVYAGFIGGAGNDLGNAIAVDATGAAYVAGDTTSDQTTFPVLVGPRLTHGGGQDAFLVKVRPDGTGFVYAGYIGGNSQDSARGVAVDTQGNAYVAGSTYSTTGFPVTVGPSLVRTGYGLDAFVAKVRADGTDFVYAGYIGGDGSDMALALAVDAAGNAYVAGETYSSESSFPVQGGPSLVYRGATYYSDAFVARVRADGGGLAYAGYIGGDRTDGVLGIAVDPSGNAYVAGYTQSTQGSFPVLVGPQLQYGGGSYDGFVAKISSGGNGPDLIATAVSDPPVSGTIGTSFSVTVTVQNQGLTSAGASQTRFFLSLDAEKSADDVQFTAVRNVAALAPGATATATVSLTVPSTTTAGSFFVLACADAASVVTEIDEANNCRPSASRVEIALPDLIVTALTHSAGSGTELLATETTANQGTLAAGTSTVTRFYLSADAVKSADDRLLVGAHGVVDLAAGATSQATTTLTIPGSTPPGVYVLLACADDTVKAAESNEQNNCRASSSGQVAYAVPNLKETIDSVSVSGPLRPGQTFLMHDTASNDSPNAVGVVTTTRYLLSLDATRSASDLSLGTRSVAALGPGGTSSATVQLTIPTTVGPGAYFVLACADDPGAVPESSETDNCAASSITVALPDLVEQSVGGTPGIVPAGLSFTAFDTTRNLGTASAPPSVTRYFLSLDQVKSANDILLAGDSPRPELPASASFAGNRTVTVPGAVPPGQYFVLACADANNTAPETSESNNCASSATRITVVGP